MSRLWCGRELYSSRGGLGGALRLPLVLGINWYKKYDLSAYRSSAVVEGANGFALWYIFYSTFYEAPEAKHIFKARRARFFFALYLC